MKPEERKVLVNYTPVPTAPSKFTLAELYAKPTNMSPDTSALQAPSEFGEEQRKEPRHLSFAELKTLIEQGRTDEIPYNKQIPDKLNVSLGSSISLYRT